MSAGSFTVSVAACGCPVPAHPVVQLSAPEGERRGDPRAGVQHPSLVQGEYPVAEHIRPHRQAPPMPGWSAVPSRTRAGACTSTMSAASGPDSSTGTSDSRAGEVPQPRPTNGVSSVTQSRPPRHSRYLATQDHLPASRRRNAGLLAQPAGARRPHLHGRLRLLANPGHVGMYIGDGLVVHAPETGLNIMITPLKGYWSTNVVTMRRIVVWGLRF
jgi:hypothetical protein